MIKREEIEGSKYAFILNKGLPDRDLEFFWYGFIDSILNAINGHDIPREINEMIMNQLEPIREKLNNLQKDEKYDKIPELIQNFIIWIGKNFMIQYAENYVFGIYQTNLKRWARWILELKEHDQLLYQWLHKDNQDYFQIFFDLKTYLLSRSKKKSKSYHEYQIVRLVQKYHPDKPSYNLTLLHEIMDVIVQNEYFQPNILELLDQVCPVIKFLKEKGYLEKDLEIKKPYSFAKIIKKHLKKKT